MRLVTFATSSQGYMPYLLESCRKNNAKLEILGWGKEWKTLIERLYTMIEYLSNIDDNEIVCFLDAYDVIMLRPQEELENFFRIFAKSIGVNVVIGCDKHFSMFESMFTTMKYPKCQNKNLNAGTYIGFARNLQNILKEIVAEISTNKDKNDQKSFISFCKRNTGMLHIDCDSIFFLTIMKPFKPFMDNSMRIENKQLVYNSHKPFFAHGNGNTNMNDLLVALGYNVDAEFEKYIRDYHIKTRVQRLGSEVHDISKFVLVCFLIIFIVYNIFIIISDNRCKQNR